jgi:hypothetical protein
MLQLDRAYGNLAQDRARMSQDWGIQGRNAQIGYNRDVRSNNASLGTRNIQTGGGARRSRAELKQDYDISRERAGIDYQRAIEDRESGYGDMVGQLMNALQQSILGSGLEAIPGRIEYASNLARQASSQAAQKRIQQLIDQLRGGA